MTRFTKADIQSTLKHIEISAKMQGLLPWEASLVCTPYPMVIAVIDDKLTLEQEEVPFLPEFEQGAANKDVMRALTATLKVLYATDIKMKEALILAEEEQPIYWDNFVEDDVIPVDELPFKADTARIIDEGMGGVIAYCHVDTASRIVEALKR